MSTDGSALGYPELLRLATSNGLQELATSVVQAPGEGNHHHAIVLAGARTSRALYQALGEARRDALPEALRGMVVTVAERRAKIRALCEAVGMPQPLPAVDPATAPSGVADAAMIPAHASAPRAAPPAEETRLREQRTGGSSVAPATRSTAAAPVEALPTETHDADEPADGDEEEAPVPAARTVGRSARASARPAALSEGIGPDILARLLQMARKKAEMEGNESSEEEAMRKLDSFFQRAFGHALAEGTRMEGQRVVQRLAADLARLSGGEAMQATG